jgi:uncharacterized Rmd1/YagE family protein
MPRDGSYDELGGAVEIHGLQDDDETAQYPSLEQLEYELEGLPSSSRTHAPIIESGEGPAQTRRRTRRGKKFEPGVGSVFALLVGETLNLERILEDWGEGEPDLKDVANDISQFGGIESEVLLLKLRLGDLDCFILEIGVIVCWGCSRPELGLIASKLGKYVENDHHLCPPSMYEDDFVYIPASIRGGSAAPLLSYIRGDVIYLSTDSGYERLSYSYAIAQSVKLDAYEDAISKAIAEVKDIPEKIVSSGQVGMTVKELNQRIGELYIHRSNLNLHSDILDTPNCLWDLDTVSAVYRLCRKYQDIEKRLTILNQRLDVMKDMYEMVQSELHIKDYARLEMIVVWLIVLEVIIDLILVFVPMYLI